MSAAGKPSTKIAATCWTIIGDVAPLDPNSMSDTPLTTRLALLKEQGWSGLGFTENELHQARRDGRLHDMRRQIDEAGMEHVEVEFLNHWWLDDGPLAEKSERDLDVLLEAAEVLGASFIKIGTDFAPAVDDIEPFIKPLRRVADRAAERGQRIVLEPCAVSLVDTVPKASEIITRSGTDNCGLIIDAWHVFRCETPFQELLDTVPHGRVWAVELSDANREWSGEMWMDTIHRRRYCGEGEYDVSGLVDTIRELGFDGPWGIEIISDEHRAGPLDVAMRRARDTTLPFLL